MIKRFTLQIVLRIGIILLLCIAIAFISTTGQWFTLTGLVLLMAYGVYNLINYVNATNYTLVKFLDALKNKDYSVYFHQTQRGNSFKDVFRDFNDIITMFKQNKIDKEAQFEYFRQILEQISIGIISILQSDVLEEGTESEILFLNKAACELLDIPRHKYWHRIAQHVPWFEKEIAGMAGGGARLLTVRQDMAQQQLSIEVTKVDLVGQPYLIISLKDIQTEIEQKEMEAWHNIIRVLAHEMMNSFTPVSSLASTIKTMTEDQDGKVVPVNALEDESVVDINLGVSTIKRRADGLLDFVNDYRRLSNVPEAHLKPVNIQDFYEHIGRLMRPVTEEQGIGLVVEPISSRTTIHMDSRLMEQVFINLIGNSIHALQGRSDPAIRLGMEANLSRVILFVEDNGAGIPEEIRKHIFVPFFTTREKGSGIGLSLSKTIMKQHGGNIFVQTEPGSYTRFMLTLPNP